MLDLTSNAQEILDRLDLRGLLDILIIGAIFFWFFLQIRSTTAMSLLRGIVFILVAAWALSRLLDLKVLGFLVRNSVTALLVGIPIVFQPEIRRTLERVGRLGMRGLLTRPAQDQSIESVVNATVILSRERHGALIVVERNTGLQDYIETGVKLDAAPTPELIEEIFFPNSPLHDGALILRENRLVAARCTLPLAESPVRGAGMRHRAALGITERTDAVSVVVSEETGHVSLAFNGRLISRLEPERLRLMLFDLIHGGDGATAPAAPAGTSRS